MTLKSRKEQIESMLESNPTDSFLLFASAKEFENESNWPEAKKRYELIYQTNDSYIALYYHLGKLLEKMDDKSEALKFYRIGISKCLEVNDLHSKSELESALMNAQIED
jgi:tetratricopeptide (TPR) repeat protein